MIDVLFIQEMDAEYDRKRARSLTSDESLDSFVSAPETPDLTDLQVWPALYYSL